MVKLAEKHIIFKIDFKVHPWFSEYKYYYKTLFFITFDILTSTLTLIQTDR